MALRPFTAIAALSLVLACGAVQAQRGIDLVNVNGQLLVAARSGNTPRLRELLAAGAQPDSRDRNGDSALNLAVARGDVASVDALLAAHADPNLPNLAGVTPLMAASYGGKPQLVHALLDAGARIDVVDRVKKNAATYAAGQGCTGCLQELLNAGMPVNARLENDLTLLMWTAGYGHEETAKVLLQRGADRSLRDNRGKTAADIARDQNFASLAQLLQP